MIDRYSLPKMKAIWEQENRFQKWLDVEIAVAEGLSEYGYIPKDAPAKIKVGAKFTVERVLEIEETTQHDVMAFVKAVTENLGEEGKYVHYGITSYDVVDTALGLLMRESADLIIADLERLAEVVRGRAREHKHTLMIGRTHGIHAEPITFGLKLLVWYAEIDRHVSRLERAAEDVAVGKVTGAVGTMTHIDHRVERYVMQRLGIKAAPVTTQIIQRDRHAAFLTAIAHVGSSLEKMATEIRSLQRTDIGEAEEPFTRGQKGSSAMPHKRNPILCERISGMARILRSNATAAMENVPLWHERDISHSSVERIIIPDSTMLLVYMLEKFTWVMAHLRVDKKAMMRNLMATGQLLFSQHVLLLLVRKGLSREAAYESVQRAAMKSMGSDTSFEKLLAADRRIAKVCSEEELEEVFDLDSHLRKVDFIFGRVLSRRGRPPKKR